MYDNTSIPGLAGFKIMNQKSLIPISFRDRGMIRKIKEKETFNWFGSIYRNQLDTMSSQKTICSPSSFVCFFHYFLKNLMKKTFSFFLFSICTIVKNMKKHSKNSNSMKHNNDSMNKFSTNKFSTKLVNTVVKHQLTNAVNYDTLKLTDTNSIGNQ